jgi:hypothetical protein
MVIQVDVRDKARLHEWEEVVLKTMKASVRHLSGNLMGFVSLADVQGLPSRLPIASWHP